MSILELDEGIKMSYNMSDVNSGAVVLGSLCGNCRAKMSNL